MWIDGKVYMGADDGTMYIFEAGKQKKILAKINVDEVLKGPPVMANGILYVMTSKQLYAIGGN
jgi:hypothetical protein